MIPDWEETSKLISASCSQKSGKPLDAKCVFEQVNDLAVALTAVWDDIIDTGRTSIANKGCVAGNLSVAFVESEAAVGTWFNIPPLHQEINLLTNQ